MFLINDGPRKESDVENVEEVRGILSDYENRLEARVILNENNIGSFRNIYNNVSNFCKKFGRVIVLEDDYVIAPGFIAYMIEALDRFENESKVFQVSGYMYPNLNLPTSKDAYFLPLTTNSGWATWERAWRSFDLDIPKFREKISDPEFVKSFCLEGSFDFIDELKWVLKRNKGWDCRFNFHVSAENGMVLYPRRSLICDIWSKGGGQHQNYSPDFIPPPRIFFKYRNFPANFTFPKEIKIEDNVINKLIHVYREKKGKKDLSYRIRRKLYHITQSFENSLGI
jgi:hypothetical protein